jgi:hypothetical protein
VTVDADYAYRVPVEPAAVADLIRTGLQEADYPILETVIETLGEERLLYTFPAMLEGRVSVSGAPEPADPPAPTLSVSATFRR